MSDELDVDLCIVGAGCAGLSLAAHLAALGLGDGALRGPGAVRRVLLLDPRRDFGRDRTWCYWDHGGPHLFTGCVSASWRRWEVRAGGATVVRGSEAHPYCHVPSQAFYASAQERIAAAPGITLRLGAAVHGLRERADHVEVLTDRGLLRARLVADSRPLAPVRRPHVITLLQHFRGVHLRAPRPVFDPSVATLMDFEVAQTDGLQFLYVLPFDAHEALVEATFLSPAVLPGEVYEASLRAYLERRYALTSWETLGREEGAIPMSTAPPPRSGPRLIPLGLRGGLARPSTGYAFLAIQRQSECFARRLLGWDGDPHAIPSPPPPRGPAVEALDRSFLSLLAHQPSRAPVVFRDIFAKVPADAVVRFLGDRPRAADALRVMAVAPVLAMSAEVARAHYGWLRARG